MAMNPTFPQNTLGAMRGALVALDAGCFPAYHRAMFQAMWRDGVNLADDAAYRGVLEAAGLDVERISAGRNDPAVKDRLRANTDEAIARGAFGAPSFFVGDELFFGNDRLDFVAEAVSR
jgi:2-hydroxychromene-2-carboxylate isomerase